jgi:uncharacterized protein YbcV (DUF1398 family)
MFTIEQIRKAHSKVKSGADFPIFINEIKELGVTYYNTYVLDGHIDYYGINDYKVIATSRYQPLIITDYFNQEKFRTELKRDQDGETNYETFIKMCADCGIERWRVNINDLNCTYFNRAGNIVLEELIPLS